MWLKYTQEIVNGAEFRKFEQLEQMENESRRAAQVWAKLTISNCKSFEGDQFSGIPRSQRDAESKSHCHACQEGIFPILVIGFEMKLCDGRGTSAEL